ncbi:hypothetical protein LEP1GSC072_0234, partial [Leptospira noguchii str. Bonito]
QFQSTSSLIRERNDAYRDYRNSQLLFQSTSSLTRERNSSEHFHQTGEVSFNPLPL